MTPRRDGSWATSPGFRRRPSGERGVQTGVPARPLWGPPWGRGGHPALRAPASPPSEATLPSPFQSNVSSLGIFGRRTRPPRFAVGKVSRLSRVRPHRGSSLFQAWTEYKLGGVQKSEFCMFRKILATAQLHESQFAGGRTVQAKHCSSEALAVCGLLPAHSHGSDACSSFSVPLNKR